MSVDENKDRLNKVLDRSIALLLAFASLDASKMSPRDQLSIPVIFMDMADMVEPYVKKYGGSVEEITAKFEKQRAENQMKDFLAAMMLKSINKEAKENDEKEEKP